MPHLPEVVNSINEYHGCHVCVCCMYSTGKLQNLPESAGLYEFLYRTTALCLSSWFQVGVGGELRQSAVVQWVFGCFRLGLCCFFLTALHQCLMAFLCLKKCLNFHGLSEQERIEQHSSPKNCSKIGSLIWSINIPVAFGRDISTPLLSVHKDSSAGDISAKQKLYM